MCLYQMAVTTTIAQTASIAFFIFSIPSPEALQGYCVNSQGIQRGGNSEGKTTGIFSRKIDFVKVT
jgi:hypothetical protein